MSKQDPNRRFTPGERAETGGVYRVTHDGHRRPHDLSVKAGDPFPFCRACGDRVRYALIAPASGLVFDGDGVTPPAVLVADPERREAHSLLEFLTHHGYAVEFVQSERMARSLLEHSDYDAVITALDLEGEGAGLEIAKFAKRRRPYPVVFVYADAATPAVLREMFKIPVDYCAIAPFSPHEIGSALSRMIARRDAVEAVTQ